MEVQRSERVGVRLRPDLKDAVAAAAKADERTISQWIERAIRDALERQKKTR